jgi:hypothetical protein
VEDRRYLESVAVSIPIPAHQTGPAQLRHPAFRLASRRLTNETSPSEKGARGKGRQPLSPPQHTVTPKRE